MCAKLTEKIPFLEIPEFASFIEIQLHEISPGQFGVLVNYDDENLIPECQNYCPLREFER